MTVIFTGNTNIAVSPAGTHVGPGTVVQNTATGDVGAVKWVTVFPSYMHGQSIVPVAASEWRAYKHQPQWDDLVFKVDVWRLGEQRIWYGRDISVMTEEKDNDHNDPPAEI